MLVIIFELFEYLIIIMFVHFAVWIETGACKMENILCKCMNEWAAIPLSFIISFDRFNGSMGLFAFLFSAH